MKKNILHRFVTLKTGECVSANHPVKISPYWTGEYLLTLNDGTQIVAMKARCGFYEI